MSRKKKLQKKIAVAVSVVNLLNMSAPLVLPYVNVAGQVPAAGGQIVQFADTAQSVLYRTAQAAEYNVPDGATTSVSVSEMSGGDTMNVKNGGTGTVNTMNSGSQYVSSGGTGTVNNMNRGAQHVKNGGTGTVSTMSGGDQTVYDGGSGMVETMSSGTQTVEGGTGTVSAMNGGDQTVNSGGAGTVSAMHGGYQYVRSGGTGTVNTMSDGFQYVFGTGTVTTMNGGDQTVNSGGTGTVSAMHNGEQYVRSGGAGTVNTMNSGSQYVSSGGTGTVATMSGGTQIVYNGGTSLNTHVMSGGMIKEEGNGGTITNQIFEAGGIHYLANGATKSELTVSGHILQVGDGGTAISTTVNDGGTAQVLSGGAMSNTSVNSGGVQDVLSGGAAISTTVNNGGTAQVSAGGAMSNTSVNSGGVQDVLSGGTAISTTVNDGGTAQVSAGGTMSNTTVNGGGVQNVNYDGTANYTTVSGSNATQNVNSGGTASNITIDSGGRQVVSGGVASGTIINSKGYQYVNSGGTAVSTTISNGTQNVNSGGTAASTTISNGTQNVFDGGTVVSTTISGGNQGVNSGGVASGTTISNGVQHVYSGGTTNELTIHSGGIQVCQAGATINGVTLDGGTLNMADGVKASGTLQGQGRVDGISVLSVGGTDHFSSVVVSGGSIYTSKGFVIDSGGSMKVDNTGATSNTTVKSGGMMSVLGGGTANGATLSGGTLNMAREAKASGTLGGHGTVVYDGGSGQISLGGTDNFSSFTVSGGTLETKNGFQICSSGGITVNNGGTMIAGGDVMVQTSGTLTVSSGGSFSATNISAVNGGEVSMSGGVLQAAEDIAIDQALTNAYGSVSAGGTLTLTAGATQPDSGKPLNLFAGGAIAAGSITATNVSAGGSITVDSDISANSISAGGVSAGGDITAETLALSAVPASGVAVSAGGNANITSLNVSGFGPGTSGYLISAGGTVSEMTVNGKALTAGKTVYMNETVSQPKAGIEAAYTDLSFSLATDQRSLTYDAHNTYTNIAFSTISWNADSAYYEAAATDRFTGDTAISAENLNFTFAEESQKAALTSGSTMTLFNNATGLPAGMAVNYGSGKTNVTQSVDYSAANGVTLDATMTGTVTTVAGAATTSAAAGAIQYTVSSMTLDSVDLAGWDGTTASAVPGGWTANANGVAVAGSFATSGVASGDILTATTGFFADENIDAAIKYRQGDAFSETQSGKIVNLAGHKYGGVKAEDSGAKLTYYAMEKKVETATFNGYVDWNSGEAYYTNDNDNYKFSGATNIDASGLAFEQTSTVLATGDSMTLISADGLTANNSVTQPTAGTIAIAYTDGTGISFDATAAGEVKAGDKAVKYAVTGVTLNSVDLAGWDGTTASAVPTGWTANASGVAVDTEGMTNLPNLAAGTTKEILTTDTPDYFSDEKISETNKYKAYEFSPSEEKKVTLSGTQSKGVKASDDKSDLVYAVGKMDVSDVSFSTMDWGEGRTATADYDFAHVATVDASGLAFTFTEEQKAALSNTSTMTLLSDASNLVADKTVTGASRTQQIDYSVSNGAALTGTLTGTVSTAAGAVNYTASSMTLDSVDLSGWDGTTASAVPTGWTANASGVTVATENMTNLPTDVPAGGSKAILTGTAENTFLDDNIGGSNKYGKNPDRLFTETDKVQNAVVIKGAQDKGIRAADTGKSLVYAVGTKDVTSVSLGAVTWQKDAVLLDERDKEYNYSAISSLDYGGFDVEYEDGVPETVAAGDTMTLLKANETLQEMAAVEKQKQYKVTRQSGDLTMYTVDAILTGNLTAGNGRVAFTAAANQATKLTFENVNWLDSGALIDHKTTLANVSFDGAAIDTSKINFINKQGLKANQQMTLVSDFGGKPGTVTGTRYKVGTAFEGEGSAEMSGDDLIFKTKTSAGNLSEETHTSVMAMEAGVALLAAGSEHVGSVMDDLGLAANAGPDGTSTAASVGGGVSRYETGSHVNSNFWYAVVAVGRKNETEKGSLEYGLFGEYGKGNYTLHSNAGHGDGNSHYAGGGLLAKWTNRHNVYAEASFRLGRMSDSASDILHDGAGNGYGYDVHANYYGAHVGIGKVFHYNGGRSLDVYGKYFYTKRDGVSFNAGADRYNLDSVASSVLRIGAKYGTTDKKWNWYGGLAYEYEFDGEASGTVNGTAIRSADVKGGSVRGEIGLRMDATKDNPWKADIAIYGYGGRHRGFGGSISVAYMF